jgi:predicted Rossmann-fold nucleotide-binding protein
LLAHAGFGVVSGGYGGVMEAVAKGTVSEGSGSVGVTAEVYAARDREPNQYITREVKVKSHVDRLMELIDLADGYSAVGISPGTLVEVVTCWDYMIKGFIPVKPIVLIGGEWRALCDVLFTQEFYIGKCKMIKIVDTSDDALDHLIEVFGKQEMLPDLEVLSS